MQKTSYNILLAHAASFYLLLSTNTYNINVLQIYIFLCRLG